MQQPVHMMKNMVSDNDNYKTKEHVRKLIHDMDWNPILQ